jgi:hypothetical protein
VLILEQKIVHLHDYDREAGKGFLSTSRQYQRFGGTAPARRMQGINPLSKTKPTYSSDTIPIFKWYNDNLEAPHIQLSDQSIILAVYDEQCSIHG